jgi:transcriptional regulator with XRE-family HTH domain
MTGAQIRAARATLDWTAQKLADLSEISLATIQRAERDSGAVRMTAANTNAIRRTLEAAGIEFIEPNGGGPGVRLRENPT